MKFLFVIFSRGIISVLPLSPINFNFTDDSLLSFELLIGVLDSVWTITVHLYSFFETSSGSIFLFNYILINEF
jgi:hypothetical protein